MPQAASFTVVTFNVAWARPSTARFDEIICRVMKMQPDVVCLTETHDIALNGFHCISSDADYGYKKIGGRRKVVLASRTPWVGVENQPIGGMPPGRFICGKTIIQEKAVTVIGSCIPWSAAHVSTGRKDRTRWEDHIAYLDALMGILPRVPKQTVLLGDFNQTVPRTHAPIRVYEKLKKAVLDCLDLPTRNLSFEGKYTIDHVAISPDFTVMETDTISNLTDKSNLSDHFGVFVRMSFPSTSICSFLQ